MKPEIVAVVLLITLVAVGIFVVSHEYTHVVQMDAMGIQHSGIVFFCRDQSGTPTAVACVRPYDITVAEGEHLIANKFEMEAQANIIGIACAALFLFVLWWIMNGEAVFKKLDNTHVSRETTETVMLGIIFIQMFIMFFLLITHPYVVDKFIDGFAEGETIIGSLGGDLGIGKV